MDFASLIKAARQRSGLSQSQAAAAWGIKLDALQGWEQGRNKPNAENLLKLLPTLQPAPPSPRRPRGK